MYRYALINATTHFIFIGISNQLKTYFRSYLKTHCKQIICPHSLVAIKMQTHYKDRVENNLLK